MEEKFGYEVFLGGNTLGYTFIGKEDGESYLKKFYNDDYLKKFYSGEKKESLSVQIEREDNYVYYSLVVYGIANIEGRKGEGEHFNLTLKLSNCYFTDICLLYSTMISIYKNQILNHIIKNGRYVIDNFATQTNLHKQIESSCAKIMDDRKLLLSLKKLAPAKNNNIYRCNPKDISRDLIDDLLQTYTTIRVNSTYPTKDATIKSLNGKVAHLEDEMLQRENQIKNQKDKEISDINNQLQQYKNDISKLNTQNKALQKENSDLNKSLTEYKLHGDISNQLEQLRKPVSDLYEYFSPHKSEPKTESEPKPPQQHISKRLVLLIICIILLVVVLFQVRNLNSDVKSLDSKIDNIEKIQTEQQHNKEHNSTADANAGDTTVNKGNTLQQNSEQTSTETSTETQTENQNNNSEQSLFQCYPIRIGLGVIVGVVLLIFVCYKVYSLIPKQVNKTDDNTDNKPNNKAKQNQNHK